MNAVTITPELRARIEAMTHERDGRRYISIGNSRLDFSKEYVYLGCTQKTVKLAWVNGRDLVPCQGKLYEGSCCMKICTEGSRYIESIPGTEAVRKTTDATVQVMV